MTSFKNFLVIVATMFAVAGCQKEYSLETGTSGAAAKGTLKDAAGNCQPFSSNGVYLRDSVLTDSNYVLVQVNIKTPGTYKITSDLQNGFSFRDSGYIGATGLQTIKLKGSGRPILPIATDFLISFDTTFCLFTINVGSASTSTAVYTLTAGAGGSCSNATPQGDYSTGTTLGASNFILLNVNVTTIGDWSIVTNQINGMRFGGAGTFTATGAQTIQLYGAGVPRTAETSVIPVVAGSSNCSFKVVVSQGSGTNINSADSAWAFTQGNKFFHGPFDVLADDTTIAGSGYLLILSGSTSATGDSVITIGIFFPGGSVQTGTYTTALVAGFYFEDYKNPSTPVDIYYADNSATGAATTITVTSWNPTTRVISGTFAGTAKNAAGTTVPITGGKFTAKVN